MIREKKTLHWREIEELVKRKLESEFKVPLKKQKIRIGKKDWEFDLSSDGEIVVQIKSCRKRFRDLTPPQLETRFKRDYFFDCFLLEKVSAKRKIFVLASKDKKLPEWFRGKIKGLISQVEIWWFDMQKQILKPISRGHKESSVEVGGSPWRAISKSMMGKGVYRVSVIESKFNKLPSNRQKLLGNRVIMIGSTERNLLQRIGEFLRAASGHRAPHAEGRTFYERRKEHGLSIQDLEIEYRVCKCPKCEEHTEFEKFLKSTGLEKPYLCKKKPRKCRKHPAKA